MCRMRFFPFFCEFLQKNRASVKKSRKKMEKVLPKGVKFKKKQGNLCIVHKILSFTIENFYKNNT